MPSFVIASVCLALIAYIGRILVTGLRSPVSRLPGPWYSRFTNIVLRFYTLSGRRIFYVDHLHKSYGDVVRIGPSEVAIADLAGVPQIHKTGSGFLKSNFYAKLTTVGTMREPGIFAMQNAQQHAARRRLFSRAFSNSSLKGNWEGEIRLKTKAAVDRIEEIAREPGKGVDILKWWTLMATDMITHLSFGESFGMLEQGKKTSYIEALEAALLGGVLRSELPLVHALLRHLPFKGAKLIATADEIVLDHGALAVRNMRNRQGNTMNLFGQMLAASDDFEKVTLTDRDVQDEAGNLIIAGSDTTAVTLTYLVWAVLKDTALQTRLEDEVAGLSADLDLAELENASLLNSVIEETLRLYGAAPGALPRTVPKQGWNINGYDLPAGTEVSTQAYTLHRDPRVFQDPLSFDGYRFIDKSKMSTQQKAVFMPFGAGSRICLGVHLAYLELRLATALFFRRCRGAKLSDCMRDEMMEFDNRFLIAPKGHCCYVKLE